MYGIVNQAIYGLVTENFGHEKWAEIKKRSGVNLDYFVSNEPYEDNITYELVGAASEVLGLHPNDVLHAFGEYWVLKTGMEKYGDLMRAGGEGFSEFILNLPNFHSRIMLIYPNLSPPEFSTEKINEGHIKLHYYSEREGLTYFVVGLIHGLAKMYGQKVDVSHRHVDDAEAWHDIFEIAILKH
jgi:hypothetical protein